MKKAITIISIIILSIIATLAAYSQTHVIPYPNTIPKIYLSPSPIGGIAGGLIYGISQAPHHAIPDNRVWEQRQSFRLQIRSWDLLVFNRANDPVPSSHVSGFCSVPSALIHARRHFRNRFSMVSPNPMPCWRMDGDGIR